MRLVVEPFKSNEMVFFVSKEASRQIVFTNLGKKRPACLFHPFVHNLVNENKDYMEKVDIDMNAVS